MESEQSWVEMESEQSWDECEERGCHIEAEDVKLRANGEILCDRDWENLKPYLTCL